MSALPYLTFQVCPVILRAVHVTSISPAKIFQARLKAGMTQAEVAHRLRNAGLSKVSERSVRRWETGKNAPHANAIVSLSQVLGVAVDELYGLDDDEEEAEPMLDAQLQRLVEIAVAKGVDAELRRRGITTRDVLR